MREPLTSSGSSCDGSFSEQAAHYDARAGLPTTVGAAVARAIADISGIAAGDLVVEPGAGTGEVGVHLARLPVRYVGLDSAPAMLAVFRAKADPDAPNLVVADCDRPWPLPAGSTVLVFAARVVHLLDPVHVAGEASRIAQTGGSLILGRVLREPGGMKERLRARRQALLAAAGVDPRQGEPGTRRVIERCIDAGGAFLGRREVAAWTGEIAPARVLAEWEGLARGGSVIVDRGVRAQIAAELRAWALAEFGDLDRPEAFQERFVVDVVRWP